MELKDCQVLLTGAGGFIGSHLAEELIRRGARVRALVHYNARGDWGMLERAEPALVARMEVVAGDLCDAIMMQRVMDGVQAVFHLGALIAIPYSYLAPSAFVQANVAGTLNLLEAARRAGVQRFVHTSTSETYGTAQYTPMDENHPLVGQSPYSASKIGGDKLAESYHRTFGLPVVTVRPFNTFGPRQSARAVIPTIITQALAGDVVKLGRLDPVRDLTYVHDTACGFVAAALSDAAVGEVVNLGTGRGVSVGELASLILGILRSKASIEQTQERVRPEAGEVFELVSDNRKAARLLDWTPKTSLEEGLRLTIDWLRGNQDLYKSQRYNV